MLNPYVTVPNTYSNPPNTYSNPPNTYLNPPNTFSNPPNTFHGGFGNTFGQGFGNTFGNNFGNTFQGGNTSNPSTVPSSFGRGFRQPNSISSDEEEQEQEEEPEESSGESPPPEEVPATRGRGTGRRGRGRGRGRGNEEQPTQQPPPQPAEGPSERRRRRGKAVMSDERVEILSRDISHIKTRLDQDIDHKKKCREDRMALFQQAFEAEAQVNRQIEFDMDRRFFVKSHSHLTGDELEVMLEMKRDLAKKHGWRCPF